MRHLYFKACHFYEGAYPGHMARARRQARRPRDSRRGRRRYRTYLTAIGNLGAGFWIWRYSRIPSSWKGELRAEIFTAE